MKTATMSFARSATLPKFKSAEILHLKQQLAAYRTSRKKQRQKITDLEEKLATAYESSTNLQDSTSIDIIFGDLCHNRNVDLHGFTSRDVLLRSKWDCASS
jgi:hypothetical protein